MHQSQGCKWDRLRCNQARSQPAQASRSLRSDRPDQSHLADREPLSATRTSATEGTGEGRALRTGHALRAAGAGSTGAGSSSTLSTSRTLCTLGAVVTGETGTTRATNGASRTSRADRTGRTLRAGDQQVQAAETGARGVDHVHANNL